jgi:NADPH:quinone reductase-like Zn-dependent oxidoreductase
MKAIRIHAYGGPDVLRFEDVPASEAAPNEVRVKVQAAGVNPIDSKIRAGDLKEKIPLPLPWTPGYDFSGVTDDGLEVFGKTDPPAQGSYADYVTVKRSSDRPRDPSNRQLRLSGNREGEVRGDRAASASSPLPLHPAGRPPPGRMSRRFESRPR